MARVVRAYALLSGVLWRVLEHLTAPTPLHSMQVAAKLLFLRLRDSAKPLPLQALQVRSQTWTCDVSCAANTSVSAACSPC